MSRSPSPNSITYEYGSNHCSPYRKPIPDQDILSKYKFLKRTRISVISII